MIDWKNVHCDKLSRKQAIEVIGSMAEELGDALEQATDRILQQTEAMREQQKLIDSQQLHIRELKRRLELRGEQ
jgi:hypothetical protein